MESLIWVYADTRTERFFDQGLNVLSKARQIAGQLDGAAAMVLVSGAEKDQEACLDANEAISQALKYGAEQVIHLSGPGLEQPLAWTHARALADLARERKPRLIWFALSDMGREIASRLAWDLQAGCIADCMDFSVDNGQVAALCSAWGGSVLARLSWSDPGQTGVATVAPHAFKKERVESPAFDVEKIEMETTPMARQPRLISRTEDDPTEQSLETAQTVVVGGAGMGTAEGFSSLVKMAACVGGQVGATRPPVLNHWVDGNRLIGQTGKTVRPRLLFSIGASGAVQYTAGITEAQTIVAVNRDPNAPIFQTADLGIVADARRFVELFTQKANAHSMRSVAQSLCTIKENGDKAESRGPGPVIKKLRESRNWTLERLAEETGHSPEAIGRVEEGNDNPSVSFMLRLARVLGVDPGTFLGKEERARMQDQRSQAYAKRTENYSYQTLTPGAEKEHLRAFMVSIESSQAHKPVAYKHEGEEFIFVLEGRLELTLGGKPHVLATRESIRFNSETPHKLKSLSDQGTRCLVVLYTP